MQFQWFKQKKSVHTVWLLCQLPAACRNCLPLDALDVLLGAGQAKNIPADLAPAHDLSKNCSFAVAPARFHVANDHQEKTSALLWFATLTGFCAAKPDERTKWPFLFTAWEILQLRQFAVSKSKPVCFPSPLLTSNVLETTNHCVCLGLGNECCLELTFSSISSRHRHRIMSCSTDEWNHTPPHPTPCEA